MRSSVWRSGVDSILRIIVFLLVLSPLGGSEVQQREPAQLVRRFTRPIEFDFVDWTIGSVQAKMEQLSLGSSGYLLEDSRRALVLDYLELTGRAAQLNAQLDAVFSDPSIPDVEAAPVLAELALVRERQDELQPTAEAILQEQVAVVLDDLGLNLGGFAFPPVAFQFSRTPLAVIVSPRHVIRQDANIMVQPGLLIDERVDLEAQLEDALDVSALVVPVGGLGSYPTMIQQNSSLVWVVEVVVHEWVHNYLSLRPLGLKYNVSSELRTINETVANILGREIGRLVLERYYLESLPASSPAVQQDLEATGDQEPPAFDFRAEMRETRVTVDELLAQGRVEQAERYMEERRQTFVENGYRIRRLNQAYFAFFGAYADEPGGAAGEDPVAAAVREFWRRIGTPAVFLRRVAWIDDFDELRALLERTPPVTQETR